MTTPTLTIVGDALLDRDLVGRVDRVCPDAPVPVVSSTGEVARPGGAALAALVAAARGEHVVLVTALGDDPAGTELARLLEAGGVRVHDLGMKGRTPEKIRVLAAGQSMLRVDRGGGDGAPLGFPDAAGAAIADASAVLVSDYGEGMTNARPLRARLEELAGSVPVVWDPHPRGAPPTRGTRLVTPCEAEAAVFVDGIDDACNDWHATARRAATLAAEWRTVVCVTLGARGALLSTGDAVPYVAPARPAPDGTDACGAGDAFAVAAAAALARGAVPSEAVTTAVELAAEFVTGDGLGALGRPLPDDRGAHRPSARARAHGTVHATAADRGVLVAAGGCFDLLHTGHVALLEAARRLGDTLVVCLNSDASVRRLKGPGRPVVPQEDRVAMLLALECVDAVEVFDEDTPAEVLARVRPDVFVKGGDYGAADLPEAEAMADWGGQVVVAPYVDGRSSTSLIQRVTSGSR